MVEKEHAGKSLHEKDTDGTRTEEKGEHEIEGIRGIPG